MVRPLDNESQLTFNDKIEDIYHPPNSEKISGCVEIIFYNCFNESGTLFESPIKAIRYCTQGFEPIDKTKKYTRIDEATFDKEAEEKITKLRNEHLREANRLNEYLQKVHSTIICEDISCYWKMIPSEKV